MLEGIKNKFKALLGLDLDNTNENYLEEISARITNKFVNTKVDVFSIKLKKGNFDLPNAFTFPNLTSTSGLNFSILRYFLLIGPFIISVFNLFDSIINHREAVKRMIDNPTATFTNGKANIAVPRVVCFISEECLKILDNNEVDAVLLHEVGHNTTVLANVIVNLSNTVYAAHVLTFFSWLLNFKFILRTKDDDMVYTLNIITTVLTFICIFLNIGKFKKMELHADTFAVKMGYGPYLKNAMNKLEDWRKSYNERLYKESEKIEELTNEDREKIEKKMRTEDKKADKSDPHLINIKRQKFLDDKIKEYNEDVKNNKPITQTYDLSQDTFEEVLANIIRDTWALNS